MHKTSYYIINGITWYRVITAPIMIIFLFTGALDIFKWMLPISFFTDAIDGMLARRFKVTSVFGARLDSIGDDLTVLAGVAGILVWRPEFIVAHKDYFLVLVSLFIVQLILALRKYGKPSSFHTYFAKIAALAQGIFLILFFLLPDLSLVYFYVAVVITGIELIEEIVIVLVLPKWRANVHGLYWVLKDRQQRRST